MSSTDPMLDRSRRIATATWSDALDRLRIHGVAQGLRWRSGSTRFAGRAITVREATGPLDQYPAAAFDIGAVLRAVSAGDVLVLDMGGAQVSSMGRAGRPRRGVARRRGSRHRRCVPRRRRDTGDGVQGLQPPRHSSLRESTGEGRRDQRRGDMRRCTGPSRRFRHRRRHGGRHRSGERFAEVLAIAEDLDARDRRFEEALDSGQEFGEIARLLGHL